jgi:hypothetical protein
MSMRNVKHLVTWKSTKYSCNQTANFLEVDNLLPSKFKNSFAALSGKIWLPSAFNMQENNAVKKHIK